MSETPDAVAGQPDLPAETAPRELNRSMQGFDDPDVAEQVADMITDSIRFISRYIDLTRLDGFTIAGDYEVALAGVDRGMQNLEPLVRSNNDSMLGVAMAVAVMREGVIKKHLVFDADYILPLVMCERGTEENSRSAYMLAHECAHVADLHDKDRAFGKLLLAPRPSGVKGYLEPVASVLYEEYAACRMSAGFWSDQGNGYAQLLVDSLSGAQEDVDGRIRAFRTHGNTDRLIVETIDPATRGLRLSAYLFGHLDAFGDGLASAPSVRDVLQAHRLDDIIANMVQRLRTLFDHRGHWSSPDDFEVLYDPIRKAMSAAGMVLRLDSCGRDRLDVPFTPQTMP